MIKSQKTPFSTINNAVNGLVDFVKPTFGPASNKVIISKDFSTVILDDGVAIAKEYSRDDEFENAVVKLVKDVAVKTNDRVGDGTTGSLIILQAIMNEIEASGKIDTRKIANELKTASDEAKQALLKQAKKITKLEDLEKVARISYDNPEIAKVIAELVHKVGHDGAIAVQESNTMEISSEIVDGFEFDKGYVSPYMMTNQERMEANLDKPVILMTDYKLTLATDFLALVQKILEAGHRNIVLVAEEISGDFLSIAVVNKLQGKFNALCINLPGYDDKAEFLNDLATITGGQVISQAKSMKLEDFDLSMLGTADRVIAKADKTTVIGGKGKKSAIKEVASQVKTLMETATGYRLEKLQKRLGRLVNGVAVIKVGAPTEHEMRALKYKVEDAVNAVKVAYKSGIVCGGGLSLLRLKTSSELLNKALAKPIKQLFENSGITTTIPADDKALNVVTGQVGDFLKVGVIDPVEVLVAQIESAVSIATLLITTKGILAEVKEKDAV